MNRDGLPDDLQQPHIGFGDSVQHEGPIHDDCAGCATAVSYASPAPAVYAALAPDVEYILPVTAVIYGSPAPAVYVAPAPVDKYISPAPHQRQSSNTNG